MSDFRARSLEGFEEPSQSIGGDRARVATQQVVDGRSIPSLLESERTEQSGPLVREGE
jgi:hypothetical protein